jgi:hypothetical protein
MAHAMVPKPNGNQYAFSDILWPTEAAVQFDVVARASGLEQNPFSPKVLPM